MTPAQKHKELENTLASLAKKYLIYRQMKEETKDPVVLNRYLNTMAKTKSQIQSVLFDMFLVDLDEKLKTRKEELECPENQKTPESTVNSLPPVASDGGIAQEA